MEDLVQDGPWSLKAVEAVPPGARASVSTYATWWIRTTVQRAVADQARTIRLPFGKSRMLSKAKRVYDTLQQEKGRKPTEDELAEELDVPSLQLRPDAALARRRIARGPNRVARLLGSAGKQSTLLSVCSRPQQQRTPRILSK